MIATLKRREFITLLGGAAVARSLLINIEAAMTAFAKTAAIGPCLAKRR